MRIISQDGVFDYPYENSVIFHTKRYGYDAVAIRLAGDVDITPLAIYSTKEKALKAMEMLHNAYMGKLKRKNESVDEDYIWSNVCLTPVTIVNPCNQPTVRCYYFQFPKDEDIEV